MAIYENKLSERDKIILTAEHQYRYRILLKGYFNYPDGEDLMGKLLFLNKMAIPLSTGLGLCAIAADKKAVAFSTLTFTCLRSVVPIVAATNTFGFVTYYSTILRKKDDEVNHVIGGVTAGLVYGAFHKSMFLGMRTALLVAGFAYCIKENYFYGHEEPLTVSKRKPLLSTRRDFDLSLTADPGNRTWAKSPDVDLEAV